MKISLLVSKENQAKIFSEKYYNRIRKSGELCIFDQENFDNKELLLDFVKGSEFIITSWGSPAIDKDILDVCPDLRGVFHAAGSIKPVLSDELIAKENICLVSSAIAIGQGVAESALGFAITACKGGFTAKEPLRNGGWLTECPPVVDFYDIKVGVIGAGFVGRHMIKLLHNFHVDVLLYDPTLSAEEVAALGAEKKELNELLSESDVISVHAPSIPATEKMINASNLPLIRDGAVVINTARGAIFDEPALIEELKKNRFFACIDVTEPEPPEKDNLLRSLPNVNLTPHVAGTVSNGLRRIALHVCEELERLLRGETPITAVDRKSLSKMA